MLKIITIDLSFHIASAEIIKSILNHYEINYSEKRLPHELAFKALQEGDGDFLCAAWLDGSHGIYYEPLKEEFEKLAVIYKPYAFWGVPNYIPADLVSSVSDLKKPEILAQMNKKIQGIGMGAGISRFSLEIIDSYNLSAYGYRFLSGTLNEFTTSVNDAFSRNQWTIIPIWKPQWLHVIYGIRELHEPKGLLRGIDEATLLIRKEKLNELPAKLIQTLRGVWLGNDGVTALDFMRSKKIIN